MEKYSIELLVTHIIVTKNGLATNTVRAVVAVCFTAAGQVLSFNG